VSKRASKATQNLKGLISESHCCIDCGYNTNPGCPTRAEAEQAFAAGNRAIPQTYDTRSEVYMVHDHVWQKAGMQLGYSGCLCIGCLEQRIGRELMPMDFPDHVFNTDLPGTPRLVERRGTRCDVLGEFPEDETAIWETA
jgi:hypothetical protein